MVYQKHRWIIEEIYQTIKSDGATPLRLCELADKGKKSPSNLSRTLIELEESGYIKKIHLNGNEYYIPWEWGLLIMKYGDSALKMDILDMDYLLSGGK